MPGSRSWWETGRVASASHLPRLQVSILTDTRILWPYFNRDGKLDVAVADWGSSTIAILLNHGRQSQTSTTLASSPNPGIFSQAVTFTAAVSSGSEKPTGLAVFWDGS